MAEQAINLSIPLKEVFEMIPEMAEKGLQSSTKAQELTDTLKDTEFSFVFDFDGEKYNLVIKDGKEFKSGLGDLDKSMFRMSMKIADIEKMADIKNAQMFLAALGGKGGDGSGGGMGADAEKLSQAYSTFSNVKGAMNMVLVHEDESESTFGMVFNDSADSELTIKVSMKDATDLISGESDPISMFMGGKIQMEGDISIAMSFQSLIM